MLAYKKINLFVSIKFCVAALGDNCSLLNKV